MQLPAGGSVKVCADYLKKLVMANHLGEKLRNIAEFINAPLNYETLLR
jgi:hypothetical protein